MATLRLARAIATAVLLSTALAGCSTFGSSSNIGGATPEVVVSPSFPPGSTMARLAARGSITIGTKFDQPLFGLVAPSGTPVGFDVEIGKIIAGQLGIPPENIKWVETVTANKEPFIQNHQVDIVVATYTINDKRKQVVSFAGPYYMAGQSILVLNGDDAGITDPEDLIGQPVCSVTGSTPAAMLAKIGAIPVLTDTYTSCLEPLRNGAVVAMTSDNVVLAGLIAQNPGEFMLVGEPFTKEPYGIGLAREDTAFRMWIDDVLEKSYADGSYRKAWEATAGVVLPFVTPPPVDRY